MVRFKINDREFSAEDGLTILDAARQNGIVIPTLCHDAKLEHYTSCMACLVKDRKTGRFIASCSSRLTEGMDIASDDPDVLSIRRKSVELLLSEHRADCEAPCRMVCPAGYNIPLMNRLIAEGRWEKAIELSKKQTGDETLWCLHCQGYCMNACKRKKIDIQVAIRDIQIFTGGKSIPGDEKVEKPSKPAQKNKRFQSLAGKVTETELHEWLKECADNLNRHQRINERQDAEEESKACMHCDCRASENCDLRRIAEDLSLKNPSGKLVNGPAIKKINRNTNLIFENAKCIKCGLCVRLCAEKDDGPTLCFLNRGFVSTLSEPLSFGFEEVLKTQTREVIEICPTGALAWFRIDPSDETGL